MSGYVITEEDFWSLENTRDMAELVQKSNQDAVRIIQDRMKESYEEIRQGFSKK